MHPDSETLLDSLEVIPQSDNSDSLTPATHFNLCYIGGRTWVICAPDCFSNSPEEWTDYGLIVFAWSCDDLGSMLDTLDQFRWRETAIVLCPSRENCEHWFSTLQPKLSESDIRAIKITDSSPRSVVNLVSEPDS